MVSVEVCADSGLLPPCPRTITELFIEGTQPTQTDDWHWTFALDTRNGLLAGAGCPSQFTAQKAYTLYPAEAQDWVRRQGIPQPPRAYSPLCPAELAAVEGWKIGRLEDWKTGGMEEFSNPPTLQPSNLPTFQSSNLSSFQSSTLPSFRLILTSPDQGSRYRLSPEIPSAMQRIAIAARPAGRVALREVTLLADGRPLVKLTQPPYQILWSMTPGRHDFSAVGVDVEGNSVQGNRVVIEVVE
jgi:hypothetical protein